MSASYHRVEQRLGTGMTTLSHFCQSRWVLAGLVVAGLIRSIGLLLAYPPGHGSDSLAYYLYAERLAGADFPNLEQLVPPLYPWLILITYQGLHNVYLLIGLQVLMAIAIAPLYYLALRQISPILAVLVSLVVLGDLQTAIVANFASTEPLYIFLLALLVYALMAAYSHNNHPDAPAVIRFLVLAGVAVGLLFLARPVAKFLIVPVLGVSWLVLRRMRPVAALAGGFVAVILLYMVVSVIAVGRVEGLRSGFYMAVNPTVKVEKKLLESGDIEDSALSDCDDLFENCLARELAQETDQETSVDAVFQPDSLWSRAKEFLLGDFWRDYAAQASEDLIRFLVLSGQQYGFDAQLPSDVQCANTVQAQDITMDWIENSRSRWTLPYDEEYLLTTMRDIVPEWTSVMCPPKRSVSALRSPVETVMMRYRSLARPRSQLVFWYLGPLLLALIMPRARRFLPLIITMVMLIFYHALISAVSLNVQPRYALVINPFRAVMIVLTGYLVLMLAYMVIRIAGRAVFGSEETIGE